MPSHSGLEGNIEAELVAKTVSNISFCDPHSIFSNLQLFVSPCHRYEIIISVPHCTIHTHNTLNKFPLHSLRVTAAAAALAGRRRRRRAGARTAHSTVHAARPAGRSQSARIRRRRICRCRLLSAQHLGGAALDARPRSVDHGVAVTGAGRCRCGQLVQAARTDHHCSAAAKSGQFLRWVRFVGSRTLLHHR